MAGSEAPTDRERRAFEAAAIAHAATGVLILTHCTEGIGALEQLRLLSEHGVAPAHVTLSHTDKVVDRGYYREIVATGAFVEYDQGFRWKAGVDNGTLTLLAWMIEEGHVETPCSGWMLRARATGPPTAARRAGRSCSAHSPSRCTSGIGSGAQDAIFVGNPARAFAFAGAS